MSDGSIFDLGEKSPDHSMRLKLSGTRSHMQVDVPRDQMPDLLKRLQANRHVGKFYVPSPDHEVLKALKTRFEQQKVLQSEQELEMTP